jgi:hypothetical protein
MIGEVEPLKSLQCEHERSAIIDRILKEYPEKNMGSNEILYRIRKNPKCPDSPMEYDSPPNQSSGRLDGDGHPILYASPDLQVCIHECRITAEDNAYVATLQPTNELRFLDLTRLLEEEHVTEFESLDMAVHMLFLAGEHSYEITRGLSRAALESGFDGIIYPSYFSLLRIGEMPFQTAYGISKRRFPQVQKHEESKSVPNMAIFGYPIREGLVSVKTLNKLILSHVHYEAHFGPVTY